MNYRTDLAVEADELLEDAERADETRSGAELSARRAAGYIKKQRQLDEDIAVIEIEILNEEGEKAFQRPRGTYVTIEIQGLFEEKENIRERASRAVAAELKKLIPFDYFLKVLVVGLGNERLHRTASDRILSIKSRSRATCFRCSTATGTGRWRMSADSIPR